MPTLREHRSPALPCTGHFPAYRCRVCAGYYILLTGTVFAKTRQPPATLVVRLRGMAKGEPTARLARELGLSRKQLHTLRQRIQTRLNATAPTAVMVGTAFEADELYHNAGETRPAPWRPSRPATSTGQYTHRPRHRCERSAPDPQYHLARDGRAALVGGRPCRQADVPGTHHRKHSG